MKKNEISQPLIMNCKCNFSHMVLGTYNMAISCQFQRNFYSYLSYPIIIKGNLKEKGSRFILKREDLDIYMFYEITDIIITDRMREARYFIILIINRNLKITLSSLIDSD